MYSLNFKPTEKININTYFLFQNKSIDTKYNQLPNYQTLNMNANYLLMKNLNAHIKIENLLDRNNIVNRGGGPSENLGYQSPSRSIYFGLKLEN